MRTGVIAFSLVALILGAWIAVKSREREAFNESPTDVARNVVPLEAESVTMPVAVPTAATPDTPTESGDRAVTPTPSPMRHPYHEPEFREMLVGYLAKNGLSSLDGERIVDAAIDRLLECVVASGSDVYALRICELNVLSDSGLNEAVRNAASIEAARNMSRRLALEAAERAGR